MRRELLSEEIEEIQKNEYVVFSTCNGNKPRAIIVMPSRVESNRIILSNIQMKTTIENIKNNPNGFINVYLKNNNDKQYKIECFCDIHDKGELFEEIKDYEETNNLPANLRVSSIIVANFKNIDVCEE